MAITVSSFCYQSTRSDEGLRGQLVELARKKPRSGYRRLPILLIGNVERVNHKRVYRVYREAGLAVAQEGAKRLVCEGSPRPALTAETRNGRWISRTMPMASGRAIRV
jgi:putative transposase